MTRFFIALLAAALLVPLAAQSSPPPAPAVIESPIRLYSGPAPGGPVYKGPEKSVAVQGTTAALLNVGEPTLTPVLPARGRANGTAVIVVPGGGYVALAIDHEGYKEARWLAAHGVTAFVLKYRVRPSSGDLEEMKRAAAAAPKPDPAATGYEKFNFPPAVADAQAAVRLVRARAARWGLDPHRIGMLGFSAGSINTLLIGTNVDSADRPDFLGAIYPPLDPLTVPADAPPLFLTIALDDELFAGKGFGLIEAWQKAKRPIEAHLYERGGHGFGMGKPGTTTTGWIDAFLAWMTMRGLVPTATQ